MMKFTKGKKPDGFDQSVQANKARVAAEVAANQSPKFKGRESWKKFKPNMAPATFGKCGYCEVDVWGVDRFKGDVEHYRPKGRIDAIADKPDGTPSSTVRFTSGYPWLAYDWSNYILSCSPCNSAHKKNLFPVKPAPTTAPVEGSEKQEKPLLLTPFGRKDPTKHLLFDEFGIVGPRRSSPFGKNTIRVCGLNRSTLMKRRRRLAGMVRANIAILMHRDAPPMAIDLALESLARMGAADVEHSGMVRGMFAEATGQKWSIVEQAVPLPEPVFIP
jgi:hypothetical protein